MDMTIRQLIQEQISSDEQIRGMLAEYDGEPAFFYQKAPHDKRDEWDHTKYPRADFVIDMRYDAERKRAGTMTVNIWCNTECSAIGDLDPDRAIEKRLIELISGVFYTVRDDGVFCIEWDRSDEFLVESQNDTTPEMYGLSMTFELLAFPEQLTVTPDPVQGLNIWTKKHFDNMTAIAFDNDMPDIWKPTDEHPAIYWRLEGIESTDRQSYAAVWYSGRFYAHVIAQSVKERNRWMKAIIEHMQLDGELLLPDGSPMFIERIEIRHNADPVRAGQLSLTGRYGVQAQQRKERAQLKLNNINKTHYGMKMITLKGKTT